MDSGAVTFFTGFAFTIGFVVVLIELVVMCVASLFSRKERNMFADQIRAGAKLLDEKVPEWLDLIDLEDLDLCDTCSCVVGQSYPDKSYGYALMELFDENDGQVALNHSHLYGFAIHPDGKYADYEDLTTEWKSYIQERRTKQKSTIEQVP